MAIRKEKGITRNIGWSLLEHVVDVESLIALKREHVVCCTNRILDLIERVNDRLCIVNPVHDKLVGTSEGYERNARVAREFHASHKGLECILGILDTLFAIYELVHRC